MTAPILTVWFGIGWTTSSPSFVLPLLPAEQRSQLERDEAVVLGGARLTPQYRGVGTERVLVGFGTEVLRIEGCTCGPFDLSSLTARVGFAAPELRVAFRRLGITDEPRLYSCLDVA